MGLKTGRASKGKGSLNWNSKHRGRGVTWGTMGRPCSASSLERRCWAMWASGEDIPASIAVQLMVMPYFLHRVSYSSNQKPLPAVTCITASRFSSVEARVSSSSSEATRLGTGLPLKPTWVGDFEVAKPRAPASSASSTIWRICSISSVLASRSVASSPIT